MKRLIPLVLLIAMFSAHATNYELWFKHPELLPIISATNLQSLSCYAESTDHFLAVINNRAVDAARAKLQKCVESLKEASKVPLMQALKYLEQQPGATKALKAYYLAWRNYLEFLPDKDTRGALNRARQLEEAKADAVKKLDAFELEVELGT